MIKNVADLHKLAPVENTEELFFAVGCTVCSYTCRVTAVAA
jgi:hypothetical protein